MKLQKIKIFLPAGEASTASGLGAVLGQYQINPQDFLTKFNQQSLEIYEKGVILSVFVFRNPKDKTFVIYLKGPTIMGLISAISKLGKRKKECLHLTQLFDIVKIKHKILNNSEVKLENVAASIFSSISSSKIAIYKPKNEKI